MVNPVIEDLFRMIKLTPEFLERNRDMTRRRLINTYSAFKAQEAEFPPDDEMFVINRCLHLASSLLLLGSDANMVPRAIEKIKSIGAFMNRNPTTVLTVATLYYLIAQQQNTKQLDEEAEMALDNLRKIFDRINWLIGPEGMSYLSITAAKEHG